MPELANELQELLKETESQISKLPPAPDDDAQGEVIMLVSGFARELATYVEGTPDDNGIHQAIRPLNKMFFTQIYSTAPKFYPFTRGTGPHYTHPTFASSGDEPQIYPDDDGTVSLVSGASYDNNDNEKENGNDNVICVDEVMDMEDR